MTWQYFLSLVFFSFFYYYYRPQRSWAKVIFSQACVKNSVHRGGGGCLPQCMLGYTTTTTHPLEQSPPDKADTPPGPDPLPPDRADPSRSGRPPTPLGPDPPPDQADTPPPREADCSIRSTSGRYASYWNVFLFYFIYLMLFFLHCVQDKTCRMSF